VQWVYRPRCARRRWRAKLGLTTRERRLGRGPGNGAGRGRTRLQRRLRRRRTSASRTRTGSAHTSGQRPSFEHPNIAARRAAAGGRSAAARACTRRLSVSGRNKAIHVRFCQRVRGIGQRDQNRQKLQASEPGAAHAAAGGSSTACADADSRVLFSEPVVPVPIRSHRVQVQMAVEKRAGYPVHEAEGCRIVYG
jgi:hypothetical protein